MKSVTVNGRRYRWPENPTVVICLDGCASAYIDAAVQAGVMPKLAAMVERGTYERADAVVPTFTNPNNVSIITGVPPAVHGIAGNYFWDAELGREVMMNGPEYLRVPTLLAELSRAGAKVAAVTAKDKLRRLLGHGLTGVCFSTERLAEADLSALGVADPLAWLGARTPSVYSAEVSTLVLAAGVRLLETWCPALMYLSTTDYIQHQHAPGTPVANAFYAQIDVQLGHLLALGANVAITADHGMNAKTDASGAPDVRYLQDTLDAALGAGATRVILPITDPYVVHHGALGSYATVHVPAPQLAAARAALALPGIETVLTRDEACTRFGLPPDRVGDLVVLAQTHTVLGTAKERHDLSALQAPLRSHGGISEQEVPLLLSRRVAKAGRWRNFDAFALALNGALESAAEEVSR